MADKKFDITDNRPVNAAVIVPGKEDELEWISVNRQIFNPACLTAEAVDAVYEKPGKEVILCSLGGDVLSLKCESRRVMRFSINGKLLKYGDAITAYGVLMIRLARTYRDMWHEGTMPRDLEVKKVAIPVLKSVLECCWNFNSAAWERDKKGHPFVRYRRKRYYPDKLGDALPRMRAKEDVNDDVRNQAAVEIFVSSHPCPDSVSASV